MRHFILKVKTIEILDIECVLPHFLSERIDATLTIQNGRFIRAFFLVPISCGEDFRAVAGSEIVYFKHFFFKV